MGWSVPISGTADDPVILALDDGVHAMGEWNNGLGLAFEVVQKVVYL